MKDRFKFWAHVEDDENAKVAKIEDLKTGRTYVPSSEVNRTLVDQETGELIKPRVMLALTWSFVRQIKEISKERKDNQ